jgi:hypothetical protein
MHTGKLIVLILALLIAEANAESLEIPCEGSPETAQLSVPAPANKYLHIVCTKYGHILHPTEGWFWTQPGGFSPVFYPAQMVRSDPEESGNEIFFQSIEVTDLTPELAAKKWGQMEMSFDPSDPPPQKAMEVVASTSTGSSHTIYVFEGGWGWSCSPSCESKTVFLMISKPRQEVAW